MSRGKKKKQEIVKEDQRIKKNKSKDSTRLQVSLTNPTHNIPTSTVTLSAPTAACKTKFGAASATIR